MNHTYIPLGKHKERSWYLIDAENQTEFVDLQLEDD